MEEAQTSWHLQLFWWGRHYEVFLEGKLLTASSVTMESPGILTPDLGFGLLGLAVPRR